MAEKKICTKESVHVEMKNTMLVVGYIICEKHNVVSIVVLL